MRRPPFARESLRWSEDPRNLAAYESNGFSMGPELVGPHGRGIPEAEAFAQLPRSERDEWRAGWPYDMLEI
jgi:hypothetical protein